MSQILDITASADAAPWNEHPSTNYGTLSYLYVGEWSGGDKGESFINFDLSSLPSRFRVSSAILKLFQYDSDNDWQIPNISVAAELCGASWTETGITWNNKPANAVNTPQALTTVKSINEGVNGTNEYQWNITEHMIAVGLGLIPWNGLRLRYTGTSSETAKYFRSREYGTASQRPRLYMIWDYPFGKVNVNGTWKNIERALVNINGVWKDISEMKVNVNNVWKNLV